jgi:hypothetical protein
MEMNRIPGDWRSGWLKCDKVTLRYGSMGASNLLRDRGQKRWEFEKVQKLGDAVMKVFRVRNHRIQG